MINYLIAIILIFMAIGIWIGVGLIKDIFILLSEMDDNNGE